MIGAYFVAFVNAVLAMIVAFGITLTQTQVGTITGSVNAAIVLIGAVWQVRKKNGNTVAPARSPLQ